MTNLQGKILSQIEGGATVIGGKFHATLKALASKGYITVEREEKTSHITDFREVNYHGQFRSEEFKKQIKYVIFNVKLIKED
jgi:hypothetical protein